jgi:hypothetical protein
VPEPGSRADAFRQAGIYVAAHCHVLMALWDGSPPDANSCGTSAAVDIALRGNYRPQTGSPVHKGTAEAVIHILTPRDASDRRTAGAVRVLGDDAALEDIYEKCADIEIEEVEKAPDGPETDRLRLAASIVDLLSM